MNKKIRNSTYTVYDNISFKSILEKNIYKIFKENGFDIAYEPHTFTLWEGYKPTIPFYDRDRKTRLLVNNSKRIIGIKYTPDFIIRYCGITVYIEVKGIENDVFYIKKKLFRKYLESMEKVLYFELYSRQNALQAIEIIKEYAKKETD